MIRVSFGRLSTLKAMFAFVVLLALFAGGCSIGDSEKKEKYMSKVDDLTKQSDKEVGEYNDSVIKYQMGQISAENMVLLADKNRKASEEYVAELTDLDVPDDFLEANKLLISGYNKNAEGFELDRDLYSGIGSEATTLKVKELFNDGNTEINQAVSMINKKK